MFSIRGSEYDYNHILFRSYGIEYLVHMYLVNKRVMWIILPSFLVCMLLLIENLLKERVKPAEKWRKCLTLYYVNINATYLTYISYMAITQISFRKNSIYEIQRKI